MKPARFWSVIGIVALFVGYLFYQSATLAHVHQITYDTYISITLTALGVLLAALALFVGAAAIWGYQQISAQAETRAEAAVEKKIAALLDETNVGE